MKHRSILKIVRALPVALAAAFLFALPSLKSDGCEARPSLPFLNLLPNVTRGLNLVGGGENEAAAGAVRLGVWNGERLMAMELEEYITLVTAAEMPATYDMEALRAQAVAARTFTVKHIVGEARCKSGHTICTDHTCCQAFLTREQLKERWGGSFDKYYARIREAVISTAGLVLTTGDGEIVTALYHSSSGGRTEDCEAVFAVKIPYLVSVESGGEEDSPEFRTEKSYTVEEFIKKINAAFPDAMMTDPKRDVQVWERTESGRITLIRLGGTVITGQQLRNALKLKSTNAEFIIDDESVTIICLGFGHGVGMSQCGANAMAKAGAGYQAILKHYYTGVEIEPFDRAPELWRLLTEGG